MDETASDAGWQDVLDKATNMPVAVHLGAEEVSAGIDASNADDDPNNDGAAYTFTNQTVQTVTKDGA